MCVILLSIKPDFVEKIFSGDKKYEFRTRISKESVDKIIIYATSPIKLIVGEASVEETLGNSPIKIWEQTKSAAGISYNLFEAYFRGKEYAYAYKLGSVVEYEEPLELQSFGISQPPQSFIYFDAFRDSA